MPGPWGGRLRMLGWEGLQFLVVFPEQDGPGEGAGQLLRGAEPSRAVRLSSTSGPPAGRPPTPPPWEGGPQMAPSSPAPEKLQHDAETLQHTQQPV